MLKFISILIFGIILILIRICLIHSYPKITDNYSIDEVYFLYFMNSNSKEELLPIFEKQLLMKDNVVQDYMIAYWMRVNNICDYLPQLRYNYEYYSNVLIDSSLLVNTNVRNLSYLAIFTDELNRLENECKK